MVLKIGSRRSDLARLQSYRVAQALQQIQTQTKSQQHWPLKIEFIFKESLGDKNLTDPLWQMPEKGVFTQDFLGDLESGAVDMVVHSWKDLPTEPRLTTTIAATLPRADQRDVLLFKKSSRQRATSSHQITVFSSSPRREHNLKPFLKDHLPFSLREVQFTSVRGNVQTRVRKLIEAANVDGLILAKAALDRLLAAEESDLQETRTFLRQSLEKFDWCVLPLSLNPAAAAQGALAIEIRSDRSDLMQLLALINCPTTFAQVEAERSTLTRFGGGCHQKIGISIIAHRLGQVSSLRGLSPSGETLEEWRFHSSTATPPPRMHESLLWSLPAQQKPQPQALLPTELANAEASMKSCDGIFVAKGSAWPETFTPLQKHQVLWTSGLETWKALVRRGVWVHGSQESLGELHPLQLEGMAPQLKRWIKLTHRESKDTLAILSNAEKNSQWIPVPTYQLASGEANFEIGDQQFFFWPSSTVFLQAIRQKPEILQRHHATGLGHTYDLVCHHVRDKTRVHAFANEKDWRQQCKL